MSLQWPPTAGGRLHRDRAGCAAVKVRGGKGVCGLRTGRGRARRREGPHLCSRAGVDGEGTGAPEQLRAPPRGLLPAAAAPRLLPRCAAPGAGAESPPQLLGRPGRVTPPPPVHLSDLTDRMESPEGAGPGEIVKEVEVLQTALGVPAHGTGDSCHTPVAEEEAGIPIPAPGLLQVTERRRKY
ncbi:dysbindin domain-containing protein 1 isoform X2 [Castor canadensis]|uniref:Dysbindin domain-containing protein 1 isoform X2 n=1 Tax=Castor canadensis TaxID=51338 RepID=A0AC58L308_CASCN